MIVIKLRECPRPDGYPLRSWLRAPSGICSPGPVSANVFVSRASEAFPFSIILFLGVSGQHRFLPITLGPQLSGVSGRHRSLPVSFSGVSGRHRSLPVSFSRVSGRHRTATRPVRRCSLASAASFHRLLFHRQAFRLAFTLFHSLSPPLVYFRCLLNAITSASHQARRRGIRFPRGLGRCRTHSYRNRQG